MTELTTTQQQFVDDVERCLNGLEFVSAGICSGCLACQESYGETEEALARMLSNGKICNEGNFSWRQCESCGSDLGGNREDAHGLDSDGEIIHLDICTDCVHYLANGDLPENHE